jgi:hypothetical protein
MVLALAGIALLGGAAMPTTRYAFLRSAGEMLAQGGELQRSDLIVISVDADGAGVLEGADLAHQGLAPAVAIFEDPPDPVDREFLRRGVAYYDAAAIETMQLRELGIASILRIPRPAGGTQEEGAVLRAWCRTQRFHSILFVSTTDHVHRTRRVLERALRGQGVRIIVVGSQYSDFQPDSWWHTRTGVRTEIVESEKLLLDIVGHPFS